MNIRQFESQYAALKVLSVNHKMKNDDMFLTFKKRQNIVTENSPASWAEIVHFLKQDLLNAFVGDFLEDARNYNDYELEKLFVLLEHNQELFRIKELARDFLVLAKELTEREDSGWNTQIEAALYSPNMSKQLESGLLCLKFPFADLMAAKVKYALASPACGANYRLFIDWLPAFEKSQPLAITKVHQELANVQLQADRLCAEAKKLYAMYHILI